MGLGLLKQMSPVSSILAILLPILQPSFLVSSFTLSIHLDFGWPHPQLQPGFVHSIFLGNSFSSICTTWARPPLSTGFYYVNYVWFIVKLFQFSDVPLPPLPSLAYRTKYSAKDLPFEDGYTIPAVIDGKKEIRILWYSYCWKLEFRIMAVGKIVQIFLL